MRATGRLPLQTLLDERFSVRSNLRAILAAALVAALLSTLLAPVAAVARPREDAEPTQASGDPGDPISVEFDLGERVRGKGATASDLVIDVAEPPSGGRVEVTLGTRNAVELGRGRRVSVTLDAASELRVPVPFSMTRGKGGIVAEIVLLDSGGNVVATDQTSLDVLVQGDELLLGNAGETELRVFAFDQASHEGMSAAERADARLRVLDGELAQDTAVVEEVQGLAAADGDLNVSGTVRWTDENGDTHPWRRGDVELWEEDFGFDDRITTVRTDEAGRFSAVIDNDDGIGQGGRDLFVRVRMRGVGFQVETTGGDVYSLRSTTQDDLPDGAEVEFNLTGGDDADGNAMSVHQAMALAVPYAHRMNGGAFRDVDVVWPNGDDGSFYDGQVQMEQEDRWDWDTIHHEYGHFVAEQLDIEDNPGGPHNITDNLADVRGNKDEGIRLAWGEGWPTFFAISLQMEEGAAGLGVPRVGDLFYQDLEDTNVDYSMEAQIGGQSGGEDNELSVQRFLWDLYDGGADEDSDDVRLGDDAIWDLVSGAEPVNLSEAYRAITANRARAEVASIGCIASEQRIAPAPITPVNAARMSADQDPPTFRWVANGRSDDFPNNEFEIQFWDEDYSTMLFFEDDLGDTEFTPTEIQWRLIADRRYVNWVVVGRQTDAPATGAYTGCGRELVIQQGPGSIAELAGCRDTVLPRNDDGSSAAVALPFTLDFLGRPFTLDVLGRTFTSLYVNNNGNVTFDEPLSTYTPFELLATSRVIVAPLFADIDTRNPASGATTYGHTTFSGRPAFCVNWVDVGYYSQATDRLVSAQLLLVDRSNVAPGDFDIIFNIDRVEWETGDASGGSGGLGGSSARSGYASGGFDALELTGSGVNGAFLDSNTETGLIHNSRGSTQMGRYVFQVRNGGTTGVTLSGTVTDQAGNPVANAPVDVCIADGGCVGTSTGANGGYTVDGVPDGEASVRVGAPAGTAYNTAVVGPVTVDGADVVVDVVLQGPLAPPAGTGISPARGGGSVPVVYWDEPLSLTTTGCAGASASYTIRIGGSTVRAGSMSEGPAGSYSATVASLHPLTGTARISIVLACPGGSTQDVQFDVYIDPSGHVEDTRGNPIQGATVTLLRSDFETGPFEEVPDGSAIMSPANRTNPMVTGADGRFGWDTIAGYYVVRATADGCVDPADGATPYVETPVLEVPPPHLDLVLVLNCGSGSVDTVESLLASMRSEIGALDVPPGIRRSLEVKLQQLEQRHATGKVEAACGVLGAFRNQVQALDGKHLSSELLLAYTDRLAPLLGCDL